MRRSSELRDALRGHNLASLEMDLDAMTELVRRCNRRQWWIEIGTVHGGRWSAGGRSTVDWLESRHEWGGDFIHWLTRNCGGVQNWVQHGPLRDELLAGNGRQLILVCMQYLVWAILSASCTRCMLYSMYTVPGVNSWSWPAEMERDDLTCCC